MKTITKLFLPALAIVLAGCSFSPPVANQPADSPRYPVNASEPLLQRF